ncbi:MAG: hypothetical protein HC860_02695, partial [Alkalinema sp. RU_4_3]|nr:hypothetical protein [Alkalinema sp. RU_4_3]
SKPWNIRKASLGLLGLGLLSCLGMCGYRQSQEIDQLRLQLLDSTLTQAQAQLPQDPRAAILALLKADQLRRSLNRPIEPYRQQYHEILLEGLPNGLLAAVTARASPGDHRSSLPARWSTFGRRQSPGDRGALGPRGQTAPALAIGGTLDDPDLE